MDLSQTFRPKQNYFTQWPSLDTKVISLAVILINKYYTYTFMQRFCQILVIFISFGDICGCIVDRTATCIYLLIYLK